MAPTDDARGELLYASSKLTTGLQLLKITDITPMDQHMKQRDNRIPKFDEFSEKFQMWHGDLSHVLGLPPSREDNFVLTRKMEIVDLVDVYMLFVVFNWCWIGHVKSAYFKITHLRIA